MIKQKTFVCLASAIFTVVAALHLLRLVFGWPAVFNGWDVPLWLSGIGFVAAGALAYLGFTAKKEGE